ncbi:MAG: hypothetical protein PWQ82_773 [Thermosediminibacterales bacterium]|nr:hypothetical protein [Thermosediminibacterales bacterium]
MFAKAQTVISLIEKIAPKRLAEDWDNVGLQIGDPRSEIRKVLVALDITPEVVEEAITADADMIVSHHPFFFDPVRSIRFDQSFGDMVYKLVKNGITVYSAHTNLDITPGGVNDILVKKLGLLEVEPLQVTLKEVYKKIVVFVPEGYEDIVREAMCKAGAGWIGNYSHCSFVTQGTGSFKPLEGANPFIGDVGKLETVREYRLETIVEDSLVKKVVSAMIKAHPYEEVAYDIYPLANEPKIYGLGRIGRLNKTMSLKELALSIKQLLKNEMVRVVGQLDQQVEKVAICGGSGMSTLHQAAFKGADVLITGDVKYHQAIDAKRMGVSIVDAGHWETEIPVVSFVVTYLKNELSKMKYDTDVVLSNVNNQPFAFL